MNFDLTKIKEAFKTIAVSAKSPVSEEMRKNQFMHVVNAKDSKEFENAKGYAYRLRIR